jgi:hypothetical protein
VYWDFFFAYPLISATKNEKVFILQLLWCIKCEITTVSLLENHNCSNIDMGDNGQKQ